MELKAKVIEEEAKKLTEVAEGDHEEYLEYILDGDDPFFEREYIKLFRSEIIAESLMKE